MSYLVIQAWKYSFYDPCDDDFTFEADNNVPNGELWMFSLREITQVRNNSSSDHIGGEDAKARS